MEETAIQEDVVEEEKAEERPLSPRDEITQGIIDKQKAEREELPEEAPEVDEEPEEEVEDVPEEPEESEEELVTIKVDGVEQKVPMSKVIEYGTRTLQKDQAADKRLALATQKMRELDELEKRIKAQAGQHQSKPQTSITDQRTAFQTALIEDEEKAAEMYAELAERVEKAERILTEVATDTVQNKTLWQKQQANEKRKAYAYFTENYSDIASSSELTAMANQKTIELQRLYPDLSPIEVVERAGESVRAEIKAVVGNSPDYVQTPAPSNPTATKRSMPKPVKRASGRVPAKPEIKPKTNAEKIAEMRKARGLPA